MGFRMPAQIQRNAMREIRKKRDVVIRSPTGSGKTLAYMIPLLSGISDDLLDEDLSVYLSRHLGSEVSKGQQISRFLRDELPQTPLAVIVVPTRELGVQVRFPAISSHTKAVLPSLLWRAIPKRCSPHFSTLFGRIDRAVRSVRHC
jgi:superfamily II DNA/RNA helicase